MTASFELPSSFIFHILDVLPAPPVCASVINILDADDPAATLEMSMHKQTARVDARKDRIAVFIL